MCPFTVSGRPRPDTGWIAANARSVNKAGLDPAPRRVGPTWKQFLAAQAKGILAVGFVHVETVLLKRIYMLFGSEHATRQVRILGVTQHPTAAWAVQQARNLLMELQMPFRFLIRDRDSKYTATFDAVFESEGTTIIRTPKRPPRANAICERWISDMRVQRRKVLGGLIGEYTPAA